MLRLILFVFCLAHQWRFVPGYRTDHLAPIFGLDKSGESSEEEGQSNCEKKDSCTCVRKDGTGINLHHLDTAPKPRFSINSDFQYIQWNPCTGYTVDQDNDVAVSYGFSTANSIVFGNQKNASFIKYQHADTILYKADNMSSIIHLYCNKEAKPTFTFITVMDNQLEAAYQGPCDWQTEEKSSISNGSIILITFFVILILYFVIGWVVNVYVRKAEGYEKIPNHSFWSGLPSLIKDGCTYTCLRKSSKSTYESI